MEETQKDVNTTESSSVEQSNEQEVNQNTEQTAPESSEQVTSNETQTNELEEQPDAQGEAVDEKGVPWKNRFYEAERKRIELAEQFPQIIREEISKVTQVKKEEPTYTVEQLEKYAADRPDMRPWVEERKFELLAKKQAEITESKIQEFTKKQQEEVVKQSANNWVMTNPKFAECFTTDPYGRKVWNPVHPLTQMISTNMRDPDLAKRADGIAIAAKLAYADYLDTQVPQTQKKVKTLQNTVKKLQRNTLVEGGGSPNVQPAKDKMTKAFEEIRKTGSKEASRTYLQEYLKKQGHIPQE